MRRGLRVAAGAVAKRLRVGEAWFLSFFLFSLGLVVCLDE